MLLSAKTSVVVAVDLQGRLVPAIDDGAAVLAQAQRLLRMAELLDVPRLSTVHRPEKLGPTDATVRALVTGEIEKVHFDACHAGLLDVLPAGATQVVMFGCEAHVCLLQTALGVLMSGREVWVVAEACGSRHASDKAAAMARLRDAGARIISVEMAGFEWIHDSLDPRFRAFQALVKSV